LSCIVSKKSNVSFWGVYEEAMAAIARALSHPVRQKILKQLATLECCCNGELRELTPMVQSAISQHLKALLKACLILGLINPTSVAEAVVSSMCDCFATTFRYGFQSEKRAMDFRSFCGSCVVYPGL